PRRSRRCHPASRWSASARPRPGSTRPTRGRTSRVGSPRTSVEVDRRVAQGRSPLASDAPSSSLFVSIAIGSALVALALVVYTVSHPFRFYDHFEWQALAFLEGQTAIRYPVEATGASPGTAFFQDVLP